MPLQRLSELERTRHAEGTTKEDMKGGVRSTRQLPLPAKAEREPHSFGKPDATRANEKRECSSRGNLGRFSWVLTLELSGGCRDTYQSTATDPQPSA
jgi:hypothetical protein